MITRFEKMKWELYLKKREKLLNYGFANGLIHAYEDEFIENLRHVCYGGMPASIILLWGEMCNGRCYDRGLLATLGFGEDDFQLVDADIDGITLNPKFIAEYKKGKIDDHYGNHCFAERTKSDGTIWVYDTSLGLVIEKNLYYKMERPQITKINNKEATQNYIEYKEIKNANIGQDKYLLPIMMPFVEEYVNNTQNRYTELLKKEIERFKIAIDYYGICEEVKHDMKQGYMR